MIKFGKDYYYGHKEGLIKLVKKVKTKSLKPTKWSKAFVQEFGSHFSKSELQFVLEFIEELLNQYVEPNEKTKWQKSYDKRFFNRDKKFLEKIIAQDRQNLLRKVEELRKDFYAWFRRYGTIPEKEPEKVEKFIKNVENGGYNQALTDIKSIIEGL